MGVVYKARQVDADRIVALKMILAGAAATPEERARFHQEEAIARLGHPNIVKVFWAGEHLGQPSLALEYVDGGNLADALAAGPFDPPHAAGGAERSRAEVAPGAASAVVRRAGGPSGAGTVARNAACGERAASI